MAGGVYFGAVAGGGIGVSGETEELTSGAGNVSVTVGNIATVFQLLLNNRKPTAINANAPTM